MIEKQHAPRHRRPFWVAVGLVLIIVHLVRPERWIGEATYLTVVLGATVAAWMGVRRAGTHRRFAFFLALGLTSSAVGDVVFGIMLTRGSVPDVSPADVLWLASYVGIAAALFVLLRGHDSEQRFDFEGLIDAAVVLVTGMLVVWHVAINTMLNDADLPPIVRVVWSLYPVLDVVVLMLVIRVSIRRRTATSTLVACGTLGWLASDFTFLFVAESDPLNTLLDSGWLVGAVLLAAAAVQCSRPETHSRPQRTETVEEVGHGRIALALLPLLVPGAIELQAFFFGSEDAEPVSLLLGSLALVMLAFARATRLVSATRATRRKLVSRERKSAALAANSSDAVAVIDADRRIISDHNLGPVVGYPDHHIHGMDLLTLVASNDLEAAENIIRRSLAAPGQVFDIVLRVNHGGHYQIWLNARLVNLLGDPDVAGIVVNLHDITDRKRAVDELNHQAFHDALTGLANRALFRNRLDHALDRNARTGADPAVIFLDLDGFKTINDSLGHDAGDDLLREVAARLLAAVRRGDTVGRLGGDEFAILIEESLRSLDEATTIAERVLQSLTTPVSLGHQQVVVSASLGIAVGDGDCSSADLLRDADVAMYRAKTTGKAKWTVYDAGMRTVAVERLALENDLRQALDRKEFRLEYQPVIELETGRVVGFEALLRWDHPEFGVLPPDRFIPITEENGLIVPIGRWVLGEATRTAARWQKKFGTQRHVTMAVNVSGRQLASSDLVADVADALARSGLTPSSLVLEMTETVLISDPTAAAERLHELRRLGVRLAIDDFGTGYSSLSYLRHFPVDILKIDRSFVHTITEREKVPAIVRGLLDLGRTLQLETVAEGVELDFQRKQLREENCDLAQGFLFARPLPPEDAELLLTELALNDAAVARLGTTS